MNILIACEESQAVCKAFRARGHNSYSCDIKPCTGDRPEWHIIGDALVVMKGGMFVTEAGTPVEIPRWDMMIAHPPCTYLANSGVRWIFQREGKGAVPNEERIMGIKQAAAFFLAFLNAPIDKIVVENPIQHSYAKIFIPPHSQIIHPWMFGHTESKATCLWVKGLPLLKPTLNVKKIMLAMPKSETHKVHRMPPGAERAALRSKTYYGIAQAMAKQWG